MSTPHVLIADDDVDLAEALARRCRNLGLAAETAFDAAGALQRIEQRQPDVVILDVNMPRGNGLCVCEMMAHHERLRSIPTIIVTGNTDQETIRRCHALCAYYVAKCPDTWSRIEPLLSDLLPGRITTTAEISGPENLPSAEPTGHTGDPAPSGERVPDAGRRAPRHRPHSIECRTSNEVAPPWVLCIDDDPHFTFVLQLRLKEHGVEMLRASAGTEGYRRAFTTPAQAIVLDYETPEGNGDYVLRRLKENPVTKDIPVTVLTGHRQKSLERKMYNLGATRFLTKPCGWNRLWSELRNHLPLPLARTPVTCVSP